MEEEILISPVDQRAIPLTGMSRRELRDLHYYRRNKNVKNDFGLTSFFDGKEEIVK